MNFGKKAFWYLINAIKKGKRFEALALFILEE